MLPPSDHLRRSDNCAREFSVFLVAATSLLDSRTFSTRRRIASRLLGSCRRSTNPRTLSSLFRFSPSGISGSGRSSGWTSVGKRNKWRAIHSSRDRIYCSFSNQPTSVIVTARNPFAGLGLCVSELLGTAAALRVPAQIHAILFRLSPVLRHSIRSSIVHYCVWVF